MGSSVRKYIIAGLLVWLPLAITIWVLLWVQGLLDGVFRGLLKVTSVVLPEGAREGDWLCTSCGNTNFARRSSWCGLAPPYRTERA